MIQQDPVTFMQHTGTEEQKEVTEVLKKELSAVLVDRWADVTLNDLYAKACIQEYGVPYVKGKMSQRAGQRITEHVSQGLRVRYGPYANITHSKVKQGSLQFSESLTGIYRTPGGWIYGVMKGPYRFIFFTTHAIDRFKERVDQPFLERAIARKGGVKFSCKGSVFDILTGVFGYNVDHRHSGIEFARGLDGCFYINIKFGVLVFNRYADKIFVARTFLNPDMLEVEKLQWFQADMDTYTEETNFEKRFEHYYEIDEPYFYIDQE